MLIRVSWTRRRISPSGLPIQKMAAEDDPAAAEGRLAFEHTACVNCTP